MTDPNKYLDPNEKARWGFAMEGGQIRIGTETVGETGGVASVRSEPGNGAAEGNGGGDLRVPELKAKLDEKGIEYPADAKKADLQALLNEAE